MTTKKKGKRKQAGEIQDGCGPPGALEVQGDRAAPRLQGTGFGSHPSQGRGFGARRSPAAAEPAHPDAAAERAAAGHTGRVETPSEGRHGSARHRAQHRAPAHSAHGCTRVGWGTRFCRILRVLSKIKGALQHQPGVLVNPVNGPRAAPRGSRHPLDGAGAAEGHGGAPCSASLAAAGEPGTPPSLQALKMQRAARRMRWDELSYRCPQGQEPLRDVTQGMHVDKQAHNPRLKAACCIFNPKRSSRGAGTRIWGRGPCAGQ